MELQIVADANLLQPVPVVDMDVEDDCPFNEPDLATKAVDLLDSRRTFAEAYCYDNTMDTYWGPDRFEVKLHRGSGDAESSCATFWDVHDG